ncbi:MAG: hypothetical protein ABW321_35170 [Polyangiales bacterium]
MPRHVRAKWSSGLFRAGLFLGFAACADADVAEDACDPADVGESVVHACVHTVALEETPTFVTRPAGSDCAGDASFSFHVDSGVLDWTLCKDFSGPDVPWHRRTGSRTLNDAERGELQAAFAEVTYVEEGPSWGADKATLSIAVTSYRHTYRYFDVFYFGRDRRLSYVNGLDPLLELVTELAEP